MRFRSAHMRLVQNPGVTASTVHSRRDCGQANSLYRPACMLHARRLSTKAGDNDQHVLTPHSRPDNCICTTRATNSDMVSLKFDPNGNRPQKFAVACSDEIAFTVRLLVLTPAEYVTDRPCHARCRSRGCIDRDYQVVQFACELRWWGPALSK